MNSEWVFNLLRKGGPAGGKKFTVELIDTWDMTTKMLPEIYETEEPTDYRVFDKKRTVIRLPVKPYLALRIKEVK